MNQHTTLKVFLFNVGHGENILLELPDGSYGIIDFYYETKVNPIQEPPALSYLRNKKKAKKIHIKFIHFSSYHYSHLIGLEQWVSWIEQNEIPVDNLWLPGAPSINRVNEDLVEFFKNIDDRINFLENRVDLSDAFTYYESSIFALGKLKKRIPKNKSKRSFDGRPFIIDKNLSFGVFCLAPSDDRVGNFHQPIPTILETFLDRKCSNLHITYDCSAIILIQFGEFNLVFGGDAIKDNIEEGIAVLDALNGGNTKNQLSFESDFIKFFNHGSGFSSSEKIWKKLFKEGGVSYLGLSAGSHTQYDILHSDTLEHIKVAENHNRTTTKIYATNRDFLTKRGEGGLATAKPKFEWNNEYTLIQKLEQKKINSELNNTELSGNEKLKDFDKYLSSFSNFLGYKFIFDIETNEIKVNEMKSY